MKNRLPGIYPLLILLLGVLFIFLGSCSRNGLSSGGSELTLVADGKTDYVIIIPESPSTNERTLAEELKSFFEKMSKTQISIFTDADKPKAKEISIGNTNRWNSKGTGIEAEGYQIRTEGDRILIRGGNEAGLRNAYQDFIEWLGARRYVANTTIFDVANQVSFPAIDTVFNPPFNYRRLDYAGTNSTFFSDWYKLDNSLVETEWGLEGPSFDRLLPPESYFSKHPEWFSEIAGTRVNHGQWCLSNPDLFTAVRDLLALRMQANVEANYWSITPNLNKLHCTCDRCRQINQEEGSPAGTLIRFLNQMAGEFTDRTLVTEAFGEYRTPPKTKPASNVVIIVPADDIDHAHPVATGENSAAFRDDLQGWLQLTNQIMVKEYLVQRTNLVSPFPNLRTIGPNFQYYRDLGVKMILAEGDRDPGGELADLRAYITAKLLWNPDQPVEPLITQFCNYYYGAAGAFVERYINLLHNQMEASGHRLSIDGNPAEGLDSYLRPDYMDQYNFFFNQAEPLVSNDPQLRDRLQRDRLPLVFASLELAKAYGTEKRGFYLNVNNKWIKVEGLISLANNFVVECARLGIDRLDLAGHSPAQYQDDLASYYNRSVQEHLFFRKSAIVLGHSASSRFNGGDPIYLVDGISGTTDFHYSWLGFQGVDLEATLDFGKDTIFHAVNVHFLQDPEHQIYWPGSVTISVSADNTTFTPLKTITLPENQSDKPQIREVPVNFGAQTARYIRVQAVQTAPSTETGPSAWLFVDEIVVE